MVTVGPARVVGVDVGSVRSGFAWAAVDVPSGELSGAGRDPESAVQALEAALSEGRRAALILESPVAVPVPAADENGWRDLGRARAGEGNRPWSAGAGAGVLATGLAQTAWILSRLGSLRPGVTVTTQPARWGNGGAALLLAEAFVSGTGKPVPTEAGQHAADAEAAARGLAACLPGLADTPTDVTCEPHRSLNLLALSAQWAGLAIRADEAQLDVHVVRARPA